MANTDAIADRSVYPITCHLKPYVNVGESCQSSLLLQPFFVTPKIVLFLKKTCFCFSSLRYECAV